MNESGVREEVVGAESSAAREEEEAEGKMRIVPDADSNFGKLRGGEAGGI